MSGLELIIRLIVILILSYICIMVGIKKEGVFFRIRKLDFFDRYYEGLKLNDDKISNSWIIIGIVVCISGVYLVIKYFST